MITKLVDVQDYIFICFIFIDMRRVIYIYNINQKIEGIHENDFLIISKTA